MVKQESTAHGLLGLPQLAPGELRTVSRKVAFSVGQAEGLPRVQWGRLPLPSIGGLDPTAPGRPILVVKRQRRHPCADRLLGEAALEGSQSLGATRASTAIDARLPVGKHDVSSIRSVR